MAEPDKPSSTVDYVPTEGPGSRIGPYRLLQQIGEGGMGVVFMAEQEQPVRRRVALKVVKPGMDSAHVIARFKAEQQALALMDHQNIAKVFDAGVTDKGRPYFVMELVHGVPITKYCDDAKLTPRERLELFVPVCRAVQHAHQKGIIHRDLKPSNVLVCLYDGKPVAKVIDFGVAKAMEQPLTDATMFTQFGQIIGTLEYMSPEQAEMSQLGIDTRTDIYSLGVMMYELLTGTTPLQRQRIKQAALDEVLRLIREEEPPAPSSRLSSSTDTLPRISQQRRTEPVQLTRLVRGELDWIVMKSLEKDRTRRYDSAGNMADDVERYLTDEPVLACPPSTTYRLRKYAHKHRALLTTVTAFALLLIVGASVSVWQAIRATIAEGVAETARANAVEDSKKAIKARDDESKARADAVTAREDLRKSGEKLRRVLYASDLNLVRVAWDADQPTRALDLLERHRPKDGETDLRGFEWFYWKRRLQGETRFVRLEGFDPSHDGILGPRRAPTFSKSGGLCGELHGDAEGRFRLNVWETATGKRVLSIPYHDPTPPQVKDAMHVARQFFLSFFPDDRKVVVSSSHFIASDKGAPSLPRRDVIAIENGKTLYSLTEIENMHPDGRHLLHLRLPNIVWRDAATGQETKTVPLELKGNLGFTAFSADFKRFASIILDEKLQGTDEVHVFNTDTGKRIAKLKLPEATAWMGSPIAFSTDGKRLVVGPVAKGKKLPIGRALEKMAFHPLTCWDIETGKSVWTRSVPDANWPPRVTALPNGRHYLIAHSFFTGQGGNLTLIDAATGQKEIPLMDYSKRQGSPFGPFGLTNPWTFSPDGSLYIAEHNGIGFTVIATAEGKTVADIKFPTAAFHTHFSDDGKQLLVVDALGTARSWDATPWLRAAQRLERKPVRTDIVHQAARLIDHGARIVSLKATKPMPLPDGSEQFLKVFDIAAGRTLRTLGPFSDFDYFNVNTFKPNVYLVWRAKDRWEVKVVDPEAERDRVVWTQVGGDPVNASAVNFIPGRKHMVVIEYTKIESSKPVTSPFGHRSGRASLIDLDTGARISSWWDKVTGLDGGNSGFLFTADGNTVALLRDSAPQGRSGRLTVADTDSGRVLLDVPDIGFDLGPTEFSPIGTLLALLGKGTDGPVLQVREVPSGIVRFHIKNPGVTELQPIFFSPDGQRVCIWDSVLTNKSTLHVWDLEGNALCSVQANTEPNSYPVFSKDGRRLLAVREGWESLPPEEMLEVIDATPLPGDEPKR